MTERFWRIVDFLLRTDHYPNCPVAESWLARCRCRELERERDASRAELDRLWESMR